MAKVIYEKRGKIAYVTLNRPEAMNAIDLETILNIIGRPLDDQLAYEAITGYSGVANPRIPGLLKAFYEKTDKGRVGKHKTDL